MDEYFKRKEDKEKKEKENQETNDLDEEGAPSKGGFFRGLFKWDTLLQVGVIVLIFAAFFYVNRNNQIINKLFFK